MEQAWWIWILGGLLVVWGLSLILMRHWTRKRLLKTLAQEGIKAEEVNIQLEDPRPEDQQALEVIRGYRRKFLLKLWPDTQFSLAALTDISQNVVKEIANAYNPEEERPELKASLADLVALYNRVGARLSVWLNTLPVRPLKDVELKTVMQYHEVYQKVKHHPGYLFLKRHHLDKVARWAWAAKNALNPWYWSRQVAYTGSKEILQRLFLAKVASLVGEEAINLYGRRLPNDRQLRRYQVAVQEMINLALADGFLALATWNYVLGFILRAKDLEDQEKLALMQRLAKPSWQELPGRDKLDNNERDEIYRWLKELIKAGWTGPEQDRLLARLQSDWAS